jgi:hypothetical protein
LLLVHNKQLHNCILHLEEIDDEIKEVSIGRRYDTHEEKRTAYKFNFENPLKKTPFGSKHKSQNNIKINAIEFGCEFVLLIDLASSI